MTENLFNSNREWAANQTRHDPDFFSRLSKQQAPDYLWIGCADSRVPANEIVGLDPGELFVHRNVANLAISTDINYLSVLAYAVNVLKVEEIIVTGHYGCGGVRAALEDSRNGVIDHWLEPVRETHRCHAGHIDALESFDEKVDALCEFNVREQVTNVARTTIVRDAWARGQQVTVHGWIYGLADGLLRDMGVTVSGPLGS